MSLTNSASDQGRQRVVAGLCFLIAVFEGFDLQVAGIVAGGIDSHFDLGSDLLGWFFSSSTIGLFFGAIWGGKLSDRYSRRIALIFSVIAFSIFSILTALAYSPMSLIAARGLTGLGLGAALPSLLALTSESAPPGQQKKAVAILYSGVPIGGALVSIVGMVFADSWRASVLIGGIFSLVSVYFLWRYLPQTERSGGLPAADTARLSELFTHGRWLRTLLLWVSFFLTLVILYLVLNWLPTLLVDIGVDRQTAFIAQLAFNFGGFLVCFATASLLDSPRSWRVALAAFTAIPIVLFLAGHISSGMSAVVITFLLGGSVLLTQSFLYSLSPSIYPESVRATGIGAAVASGRLGSIAGPLLGAFLIGTLKSGSGVLTAVVPVAILAGVSAVWLALGQQTESRAR